MNIASLVLRAKPADFALLKQQLEATPGAEVHGESIDNGRLIVTVEDGEGHAVTDSILAISLMPQVLSVTVAYEYTDEGLELQEA